MECTHEELFQFYSQVKTNENRLSVHVCVSVRACVRACVRATYMVMVKGTTDRGSADGCSMEVC